MSKKHRTPWTFDENEDYQIMIYDAGEEPVAQVIGEDYEADAKFIIEACNHYEGVKRDLAKQISQRDKLYKELGTLNDVAVNLQRSRAALIEDNNHLRDLVRRMIPHIKDQKGYQLLYDLIKDIDSKTDPKISAMDALLNEATEATSGVEQL